MATLTTILIAPVTTGRVFAATAAKGGAAAAGGGSKEEKGLLDFILGGLQKEDQFYETDPILKKVEEKGTTSGGRKNSLPMPQKKKNGFGGLFSKK